MARLGQNFLADPNLLDAIVRDAGLGPDDVVLEVGAGEGVLTERLAGARRPPPRDRDRPRAGAGARADRGAAERDLHWGDAMKLDLGALDPAPTAMVANLPYSVATPVLLRTIEELPTLGRWTVMVQRRSPTGSARRRGSRIYGAPSVLAQLACEVEILRTVDPAVFMPRPRVESAILGLRRTGPAADQATRSWSAPPSPTAASRWPARSSIAGLRGVAAARAPARRWPSSGLPEDARAEALSPTEFAALSAKLRGIG